MKETSSCALKRDWPRKVAEICGPGRR